MLVKLLVRTPRKLAETVSAALFEAGAGGIEEQDGSKRLVVYAADREAAEGIAARARVILRTLVPGENGIGTISQGHLEMSNVNIVDQMVNMITAQRAYETNSKAMQAVDQMLQAVNQLR